MPKIHPRRSLLSPPVQFVATAVSEVQSFVIAAHIKCAHAYALKLFARFFALLLNTTTKDEAPTSIAQSWNSDSESM